MRKRILLLDDDEMVREAVRAMLEILGYAVESSKESVTAIKLYKKAKESARPFDLVIMDLTIPGGMGGGEAIRKLLKIDPDVRAIVSSGYSSDPIMANHREYGFMGVITKPYEIGQLGKIVNRVIKSADNLQVAQPRKKGKS